MRIKALKLLPFVLAIVCTAACGDDDTPTEPSGPQTDISIARVELFQGTISPNGTAFYSFNVLADRNVSMTLVSLLDVGGRPVNVPMTLGFGVPQGTGCGVTRTASASPALQAQIVNGTAIGTYCVNLADSGAISGTTSFAIRIRQEPTPLPDPAPATETFASQVAPGGFTTRSFNATRAGTADLIVDSITPGSVRLELGIGVPRVDGTGCVPARVVEITTSSGTAISMPVDIGTFCASLSDPGTLTSPASFSIRISRP